MGRSRRIVLTTMQDRLADRCVTGIDPGGRLDLDMELWAGAAQTSLPLELRALGTCVSRDRGPPRYRGIHSLLGFGAIPETP